MEEFYLEIRNVHVASAITSLSLLLLRSIGYNLFAARWTMAFPLRMLVWLVDTTLLTAAFMLMTITQQVPFVTDWLTVKVLLLGVYVILAWTALGRSNRQVRIASTIAALAVFAFVYTIARAHDPAGFLA